MGRPLIYPPTKCAGRAHSSIRRPSCRSGRRCRAGLGRTCRAARAWVLLRARPSFDRAGVNTILVHRIAGGVSRPVSFRLTPGHTRTLTRHKYLVSSSVHLLSVPAPRQPPRCTALSAPAAAVEHATDCEQHGSDVFGTLVQLLYSRTAQGLSYSSTGV